MSRAPVDVEARGKNLATWERYADVDPKFTKQITGKPYRGTSPNPQYVVKCLTDLFGPVGQGFGWEVVAEDFTTLGSEVLHWCRIRFWHTDRANGFDSYGQTKAAYTSANGKQVVDEDAPKKSLTDAIVKAASHIGIAANIFLGRWDDQKYVAQVDADFRDEDRQSSHTAAPPRGNGFAEACKYLSEAESHDALEKAWRNLPADTRQNQSVINAAKARRAALSQPAPADLGGDVIPY